MNLFASLGFSFIFTVSIINSQLRSVNLLFDNDLLESNFNRGLSYVCNRTLRVQWRAFNHGEQVSMDKRKVAKTVVLLTPWWLPRLLKPN